MKRIYFVYLAAMAFVLTACGGGGDSGTGSGTNPAGQQVGSAPTTTRITFIQLNDLHAHLTPHTDYRVVNGQKEYHSAGGLARIAGMIDTIRAENPNSVLMNIGDTYHGGVEALYTQGNAIVAPVNALGIDVGVPGNWDFAYGPAVTRARYTGDLSMLPVGSTILRPAFVNLAANVSYSSPPKKGQSFLPPTLIKEIAGIRIGFIGITSDIVPRMHPLLALGLDFLQGEQAYIDLIHQHSANLKSQGVHMVVVMSELGIQKDYQLANKINPGSVDVFFSAHTHETTSNPLVSASGAWVMEAGNDTWLGRLDVEFSNGVLTSRQWKLLDIDNTVTASSSMQVLVDEARKPFLGNNVNLSMSVSGTVLNLNEPIDTVIGYLPQGMDRRNSLENTFNDAYVQMLRAYTGTAMAITPGFRFDSVIASDSTHYEDPAVVGGNVTIEDAYRFFPVPFILSTGEVSGARLKSIIEANLAAVYSKNIFSQGGGWVDAFGGATLTLNLAAQDGFRIAEMSYANSGIPVQDTDLITVTGCSRPFDMNADSTLCSYDGFTNIQNVLNPSSNLPWSGVDFLIYGLKNNLLLMPSNKAIIDLNNTSLWPQTDFLQPLQGV